MNRKGFTLLEMLVATLIMGIAITGLLTSLTASLRNTSRLTEYDRAAMLARRKLDELLLVPRLPMAGTLQGPIPASEAAGLDAGWVARLSLYERGPNLAPGARVLQRIEFEVWWKPAEETRKFRLESFHSRVLTGR